MKKLLFILSVLLLYKCESSDSSAVSSALSGSYANILALGDNLYVLADGSISTFNITERSTPEFIDSQEVNSSIESLFFNGTNLFIGSSEGMYIYSINESGIPNLESVSSYSDFVDVLPCDPIAANENHAYVTLSSNVQSNGPCSRFQEINELVIYDIDDVTNPVLLNRNEMEEPKGLGIDGNLLFVCERQNGIKVFDISDPNSIIQLYHFDGFRALDLIPNDGLLMVIGDDQLHQFDYSDIDNMYKISNYELRD